MLEGEKPDNQHEVEVGSWKVEGKRGETIVMGLREGYYLFKLSNY
jgi:hypothetical protein